MARKQLEGSQAEGGLETRLRPTGMNHIYHFDILGDGRFREVCVVKMAKTREGYVRSVYYIDVALLDNVDKGRIKGIVTNRHADKYEFWDLASQSTLNNGKNALDYFHQLTKVEHGKGALLSGGAQGGGLAGVAVEGTAMVGSEFSDPTSGAIETQPM